MSGTTIIGQNFTDLLLQIASEPVYCILGLRDSKLTIDECPFIAYCVTKLETVFHSILFDDFLFKSPKVPNLNYHQL